MCNLKRHNWQKEIHKIHVMPSVNPEYGSQKCHQLTYDSIFICDGFMEGPAAAQLTAETVGNEFHFQHQQGNHRLANTPSGRADTSLWKRGDNRYSKQTGRVMGPKLRGAEAEILVRDGRPRRLTGSSRALECLAQGTKKNLALNVWGAEWHVCVPIAADQSGLGRNWMSELNHEVQTVTANIIVTFKTRSNG